VLYCCCRCCCCCSCRCWYCCCCCCCCCCRCSYYYCCCHCFVNCAQIGQTASIIQCARRRDFRTAIYTNHMLQGSRWTGARRSFGIITAAYDALWRDDVITQRETARHIHSNASLSSSSSSASLCISSALTLHTRDGHSGAYLVSQCLQKTAAVQKSMSLLEATSAVAQKPCEVPQYLNIKKQQKAIVTLQVDTLHCFFYASHWLYI